MMAAPSDVQEPTMAKVVLKGFKGREKLKVVPPKGRDVPHASGFPLKAESTSDELPGSAIKPSLPPWIRSGTLPLGVVTKAHLQEDHNQWTGEAQTPDQYQTTSIFRMLFKGQKLITTAKIKSSTSVENQGSPESSESKNSVLVATVRTNGMVSNVSDSHDSYAFLPSNDWSVRQDTSSPHTARPSISKKTYSEGTVVNDKKSNIKLKNKQEIQRWPKQ